MCFSVTRRRGGGRTPRRPRPGRRRRSEPAPRRPGGRRRGGPDPEWPGQCRRRRTRGGWRGGGGGGGVAGGTEGGGVPDEREARGGTARFGRGGPDRAGAEIVHAGLGGGGGRLGLGVRGAADDRVRPDDRAGHRDRQVVLTQVQDVGPGR